MQIDFKLEPNAHPNFIKAAFRWAENLIEAMGTEATDYHTEVTVYAEQQVFTQQGLFRYEVAFAAKDLDTSMGFTEEYWLMGDLLYGSEAPTQPIINWQQKEG